MGFNLAFWNRSSKMRSTKDKFSPYSNNHTDVIRQKNSNICSLGNNYAKKKHRNFVWMLHIFIILQIFYDTEL